jgi:hypothetical protein
MNLSQLLQTRPQTLAKAQHDALKDHALKRLAEVANLLTTEKYDEVKKLTYDSPAGDGWGRDSNCIDFSYGLDDTEDFGALINKLQELKATAAQK